MFHLKKHIFLYCFFFIYIKSGNVQPSRNQAVHIKEIIMIKSKYIHAAIGAINLLAMSSTAFANKAVHSMPSDKKIEQHNTTKPHSIEKTLIRVPRVCKACALNDNPVILQSTAISSHIQNIYTSFGV